MRVLQITGVLPTSMAENSGLGAWTATLGLAGDLIGLTGVELLGPDALSFNASLLPNLPLVVLTPGARVDYESLFASGRPPVLDFSLRFTFDDGSVVDDPTPWQVTVLDIDDTAPTDLAFASGGSLAAGAIGVTIGRLVVTDADSTGPFNFTIAEEDAWRFEVVDGVLKLRDGISLGLDDVGHRPLIIEVSDGRHSAAFLLDLQVTDPDTAPPVLLPGESRAGFGFVATDTVLSLQDSHGISSVTMLAGGLRHVTLQDGSEVTLPTVGRLRFADGFLDAGAASTGVQAAALAQALGGHVDGRALADLVAQAESGAAWVDIAAAALAQDSSPASDADFIGTLVLQALGHGPDARELGLLLGRLEDGASRAQVAVDVALSTEALARQPAEGVWVAKPLGSGGHARDDAGGLPESTPPDVVVPDQIWLF